MRGRVIAAQPLTPASRTLSPRRGEGARCACTIARAMAETRGGFFDKLKRGLFMTHTEIIEKVKESLTPDLPISKSAIDSLEEGLLGADVGAELTMSLVDRIESRVRNENIRNMDRLT